MVLDRKCAATQLEQSWSGDARWSGIERPYRARDVLRLRGSVEIEHTLARLGAERFWNLLETEDFVPALGALTGNQAVQMVQAGLKAIYLSGWQVAADANLAGHMYPDLSLYPSNSVPMVVRRINQAFQRADQIENADGKVSRNWFAPIIADAEAGFGGNLNAFELMKQMIEAAPPACTLKINSHRARNAAIWAEKSWYPRANSSRSSWRHGWRRMFWEFRRSWSHAPTRMPRGS